MPHFHDILLFNNLTELRDEGWSSFVVEMGIHSDGERV